MKKIMLAAAAAMLVFSVFATPATAGDPQIRDKAPMENGRHGGRYYRGGGWRGGPGPYWRGGWGAGVYYGPRYYYPPAPVYVAPRPVYVAPQPVYVYPSGGCYVYR